MKANRCRRALLLRRRLSAGVALLLVTAASPVSAGQNSPATSTAQSEADSRWLPWLGCWSLLRGCQRGEHKVSAKALEAALAESKSSFDLNSRALIDLAKAGVSASVIDVMVALSYPDRFTVDRSASGSFGSFASSSSWSSWSTSSRMFGAPRWLGSSIYSGYSGYSGYYPYGYYSPFNYSYWGYYRPSYFLTPLAPSGSSRTQTIAPTSRGQAVAGDGYTRARPRDGGGRAAPRGEGSRQGSSGASSGGSTRRVSPRGYSGGGSSGSSGSGGSGRSSGGTGRRAVAK